MILNQKKKTKNKNKQEIEHENKHQIHDTHTYKSNKNVNSVAVQKLLQLKLRTLNPEVRSGWILILSKFLSFFPFLETKNAQLPNPIKEKGNEFLSMHDGVQGLESLWCKSTKDPKTPRYYMGPQFHFGVWKKFEGN